MSDASIVCPHCQKTIELTQAVTRQVEERLAREFEQRLGRERAEREKLIAQKEVEAQQRLVAERARIEQLAKQRAHDAFATELADLKEQLTERRQQLSEAREQELALRKRARELEEKEKTLELENARRLDETRERLSREIHEKLSEAQRLQLREKDAQLESMRQTIEELKRKAGQGSQQIQGEALELELEMTLRSAFPADVVGAVEQGRRGADIQHEVRNPLGQRCGAILWESKRTKSFSEVWLQKLKDDQREARADVAVLVTQVLPREVQRFAFLNGVWVSDFASAVALACALRMHLIELAAARSALEGREEKMELLYRHLTGPQFRQRVEAIVETFAEMKDSLHKEQRAMERIWATRENQLNRVLQSTIQMYGALQGIAGQQLPGIAALELDAGDDEPGDASLDPSAES